MAEATAAGIAVEMSGDGADILSYGFSPPNGDQMLALWGNGIAVDDDPDVAVGLTFSELPSELTAGIDPLLGFQHELITEVAGGDLVIHDLLIRDHPIFVRLTGPTFLGAALLLISRRSEDRSRIRSGERKEPTTV